MGQEVEQKLETVKDQYTQVVGALDHMFKQMSLRTTEELWRQPGDNFGIGSCRPSAPETTFFGPARELLISLSEQKLRENPRPKTNSPCRFHSTTGCILGELKSPVCITWIENPQELRDRFNLDPKDLKEFISETNRRILLGSKPTKEGYPYYYQEVPLRPEENIEFVQQALEKIAEITEDIKKFPILHPEEVEAA